MKKTLILSLLLAGSLSAAAQSQGYKDGIEYYNAGQFDNAKTILERTLNDADTDKSLANYYLGQVALEKGDKAAAKSYFDQGMAIDAANPWNYVGLGSIELLNGNASAAQDFFKKATSKKNAEISVAIARAYYNADPVKYDKEYQKNMEKARKDSKNQEPAIYILEGDILRDQKNYGEAAGRYEMAINFDDNNPEGYVKYANAYFHVNPKFSISKLEELLAKQPNSALAQRELAEKYYEGNYWNKAAELYGRYIQNPNHFPEDKARYSVLLYYGEKYEPSLSVANELLEKDPGNFLMQRLRFLNEAAMKKYPEAVADAQKFFSSNPNGYFTTNDYLTYAEALGAIGQDSLAVIQYETAVEKDPENIELLKELSSVYSKNKRHFDAANAYAKYIDSQENPSVDDMYMLVGRYLNSSATATDTLVRVEAANKGLEYIDKVIARATDTPELYQRKARLYIARNNNQPDADAIATYALMTDILDRDPANKTAERQNMLKLYKEAYQFSILYYNLMKDKAKAAEYTDLYNAVNDLIAQ